MSRRGQLASMVEVLKETTTLTESKSITLINLQKKLTFTWRSASSELVVELERTVSFMTVVLKEITKRV